MGVDSAPASAQQAQTDSHAEIIKPASRSGKWNKAKCNDGTPFAFQFQRSQSGSNNWVIYLQGGGFCDNNVFNCSDRDQKFTTTNPNGDGSLVDPIRKGIFSYSRVYNPSFYNANKVFAFYCSSDVWSGNTALLKKDVSGKDDWYFSGRLNVRAMLEVLEEQYGLDNENRDIKILFAGSSAGGAGVEMNADQLIGFYPQMFEEGRIKVLNDGGLITSFDDQAYRPGSANVPFKEAFIDARKFWRGRFNNILALRIPFMMQASSIDSWQLKTHGIKIDNTGAIEEFRKATLKDLVGKRWVFSGGETSYHIVLNAVSKWEMGPEGSSFREVLSRFWEGGNPERVIYGNP